MPFLVWVKIIVSEKSSCEKSVTATTREVRMPSVEVKADVCHTPTIAQGYKANFKIVCSHRGRNSKIVCPALFEKKRP